MKLLRLCGLSIIAVLISCFCSCDKDDDEADTVDPSVYYGSWVCTASTDTPESGGEAIEGYMVGETITINENGTYSSSASEIGRTGTWSLKGNSLTATTDKGQTIKTNISISSGKMVWDGKTNGFKFHYVFDKED